MVEEASLEFRLTKIDEIDVLVGITSSAVGINICAITTSQL